MRTILGRTPRRRKNDLPIYGKVALRTGTLVVAAALVAAIYLWLFQPEDLGSGMAMMALAAALIAAPLAYALTRALDRATAAERRVQQLESTDALTECLTRSTFMRIIDRMLLSRSESALPAGALLIAHVDNVRSINRKLGHGVGDDVLAAIAATIRSSVRSTDFVGRLDGGEFGIFLRGASPQDAVGVAERILRNVHEIDFAIDGVTVRTSVTIGGTAFSASIRSQDLLSTADERLVAAIDAGRDRVEMTYVPRSGQPVTVARALN